MTLQALLPSALSVVRAPSVVLAAEELLPTIVASWEPLTTTPYPPRLAFLAMASVGIVMSKAQLPASQSPAALKVSCRALRQLPQAIEAAQTTLLPAVAVRVAAATMD
jgi:hypothetical protein